MRTQSICLAFAIVLLCPIASAQWVQVVDAWLRVPCITVSGTNLFAASVDPRGESFLWVSTDGGTNWHNYPAPAITGLAISGSILLAGTQWFGVFVSTNSGASWTAVNEGLPRRTDDTTGIETVRSLFVSGTNLYAGTYPRGGLFHSTNNGTNWGPTGLTDHVVHALAISGTNLFAGTYYGGVFLSTNNGTNWTSVNTALTDTLINALAVSGTNLLAGTYEDGVFLSTNNGTNWTSVNTGLGDLHMQSLAVSGGNLFAAPSRGVFLSTNNGTSWADVGLTASWVTSLAVCGSYLFAGTAAGTIPPGNRGGIWRRPLSQIISDVEGIELLPRHIVLGQNYPNPFNPSTTIRYGLPTRSQVTLTVFNTVGQQVAQFQNGEQEAGYHEVKFEGRGLSSGVYFYRLRAGDFLETKRFLLLR